MSSPNDLTTLADCKAWLGITSTADDAVLAGLVTSISQAILADLGRPSVLPSTYLEVFDGGGERRLALRHWPVTNVASCTIDGVPLTASFGSGQGGYVLDASDDAPPGAMQRLSYRGGAFPCGAQNVVVSYRAGYEVLGEPAMVPATPPYTVVARAPYGKWSLDTAVAGAGTYQVADGVYTFPASAAGAPVALSYGYVPADLARAACEWVADRYAARTRIGQSAKTLGGQETASFIVKAVPDAVDRLLQPYRRVAR